MSGDKSIPRSADDGENFVVDSLSTGDLNTTFVFVGSNNGQYSTVNAAIADLSPSAAQRYRLVLLADTDEPSQTTWSNRIDLDTNGYEMVLNSDNAEDTIVVPDGVDDANIVGHGAIVRRGEPSGDSHVLKTEGDASPSLKNVDIDNRVPQTAPGNEYHGVQTFDSSAPDFSSCDIAGGNGGEDCHGVQTFDSSAPEFSSCDIAGGNGGGFCRGVRTFESSAPEFSSCDIAGGRGLLFGSFNYTGGNDSFVPDANNPTFVWSLHIDVTTAGAGGSTLDIGTTNGGSEIASAVPIDSTGDISFDISDESLSAGDSIYLTPSDTNARFDVGWSVRRNYGSCEAVYNISSGRVTLENVAAHSNKSSNCCYIGTDPNDIRDYLIAGGSFVTDDPVGQGALVGSSSDANTDPIYNVAAVGGVVNLTTQ